MGYVTVYIDELTSCLKDNETGKLVETEAIKISSKVFLRKFNKNTGWYVNWSKIDSQNEIYGLRVKGTDDIQGLIAIYDDQEAEAAKITWMCTAPQNNIKKYGKQKYAGVGGHLFAVAVKKSKEWQHEGCVYGYAKSKKLLNHYISNLGAQWLGMLHENHFVLVDEAANNLEEVYDYEWADEEIQ